MRQETFVSYKGYRWLFITALALVAFTIIYFMNSPVGGRNGGTVVGYTYGTLATVGIIWLMAFGARKRAYRSSVGTVEGWLAAHVWIGLGLLLLVPLHAGFSFGCNVHTLAYVFMVVTILSGVWGMVNYATLSSRIDSHRGGRKSKAVLEQIGELSSELATLCNGKSDAIVAFVQKFDFEFSPTIRTLLSHSTVPSVDQKGASVLLVKMAESEQQDALRAISLIDQKADLARALLEESRIKALLRVWLFIHVPVSIALCVAVAVHILSVFIFW